MKKLNVVGILILIVTLVFTLAACNKDNQDTSNDRIDELESKNEKAELIEEFTNMLKNTQNRNVMYGKFIDENNYVYVVTDQLDEQKEKIMIVCINENDSKVDSRFEGGDLDEDVDAESIPKINKLFINQLNDCENPNIVVFRENEQYVKAQILEVDIKKNAINYIGCCKKNKKTEEYIGDESYKYVMDFSESDYCSE